VFNFPVKHADHPGRAVRAAREIQRRLNAKCQAMCDEFDINPAEFGIGIGIQCGDVSFGEFGHSHRDLTAIGTVVNMASRAQAAAAPGQILVTRQVFEQAPAELSGARGETYRLKGFEEAVELLVA
jgi:adenylate cyclase